jgi:NAD(P)-dependent dehydrogenase (short-subunit alcohol dehydrogenase family)
MHSNEGHTERQQPNIAAWTTLRNPRILDNQTLGGNDGDPADGGFVMESFDGRGAVITGAASGIGLATAQLLGTRGCRVVLADVESDALETAVESLRTKGIEAHGVRCDVTNLDEVHALADSARSLLPRVDIVFNNAGVAVGGPIMEMTHDDWRWVIDVDLWGPIHGVEAFLPQMVEDGGGGHLLFTSSFAGLVPNVGLGPYCVAKYGVVALAEVLSKELRQHDIGVSVVCPMRSGVGADSPGIFRSNIEDSARNRPSGYGSQASSPRVPDQNASNPDLSGRVISIDEVARLTVEAISSNRLYVLTHAESGEFVRRRFSRIERDLVDAGIQEVPRS